MREIERDFAEALVRSLSNQGFTAELPGGPLPNPLSIEFIGPYSLRLLVYARRLTFQSSEVSDHNRPSSELHMQLIFEGGNPSGHDSYLRFEEGTKTLLFGFYLSEDGYVVAAFDPDRHRVYRHSSSVQVKERTIDEARRNGMAFQTRRNGEVAVVFHIDNLIDYLTQAADYHRLTTETIEEIVADEEIPPVVREVLTPLEEITTLPTLTPQEREQRIVQTAQFIREHNFRRGIAQLYQRCAICGFQYDYILDAAHVIPVAEGGTDTYDNGLGLCPNCHRMFDKGYILVDENYRIFINTRHAEEFDQLGLADSLESLQQTLRKTLWLPKDEQYHPSPENLRRVFEARR